MKKTTHIQTLIDKKKSCKRKRKAKPQLITNFVNMNNVEEMRGAEDFSEDVIKIWNWNINGIRTGINQEYLLKFLKSHKPLIICLNEIRIDQATLIKK